MKQRRSRTDLSVRARERGDLAAVVMGRREELGLRQEEVIHHGGIDLDATGIDHLVGPAGDAQQAVGLQDAQVAGMEPAVAKGLGARLRVPDIVAQHVGRAHPHHYDAPP